MKIVGARYNMTLHEELGRGNFGSVYKTTLENLPGNYATKFIPKAKLSSSASYLEEAAKLIDARHPNVVRFVWASESQCPISPVDQIHDHVQIVLEYYPRGSVDKALPPTGLSIGEAKWIVSDCLMGLSCSHSRGILHLDIKPNNLLRRNDNRIVLSDFGQALRVSPDTGTALALDHEMYQVHRPPEDVVSPASDLWQVGVTLYRLITGYSAAQLRDVARSKAKFRDFIPRPPHCPSSLWKMIRKLLAPKPEERYNDCTEALSVLSRIEDLLDWRQTVRFDDDWQWEAPATAERMRLWQSSSGFEVEYTKNGRRSLAICPKTRPQTAEAAMEKVNDCFRRLEESLR